MPEYLVEYYAYAYVTADDEDTAFELGQAQIISGDADGSWEVHEQEND